MKRKPPVSPLEARKAAAKRAAVKAFWMTKLADMGFVFALLALWVATHGFDWNARLSSDTATLVTALLFLAVMGKSAQFPLHVWLPDAMEGPASSTARAATIFASRAARGSACG